MSGQKVIIGKGFELGGGVGTTAQRFTVADLLNIAEATGDASVAIGVEGIEAQRYIGVHSGIHLTSVEDRAYALIHDLGCGLTVGVDEIAAGIVVIVALGIAIAQGQLQSALRGNLTSELADTFLDGTVDGCVDGIDCLSVGLGDDDGTAVLGVAAIDGLGFPDVGIGKTDDTGDDSVVILLCHIS